MNRVERAKTLDEAITEALDELEQSMLKGHSENFIKTLEWWSRMRNYSHNNSLLILLQRPEAIQMAGYRKWADLGFHVKQGEEATWIRGPIIKKVDDPHTGEKVEKLLGYQPLCIFCISQTAEWPEKQPPQPFLPATEADWEFLYATWVRRLTTLYGIEVKEMSMGGLTYGMASKKSIRINNRFGPAIKGPVCLHELSHIVAQHSTHEARAKWNRQQREAQAEAACYVLCRMLGAQHPHAADYLTLYKVEPGTLKDHIETISNIVREVRLMLNFKELAKEPELVEAVAA